MSNPVFPDEFAQGRRGDMTAPITAAAAVTPDDTAQLSFTPAGTTLLLYPRCLWIGTGGNVQVDLVEGGTDIVYKNVPDGTRLPVRAMRVKTATTAADIVAEW